MAPEIKDEAHYISDLVADLITAHGHNFPATDPARVIEGLCLNVIAMTQVASRMRPSKNWLPLIQSCSAYISEQCAITEAMKELMNAPTEKVH